jgi:serine protease AprX
MAAGWGLSTSGVVTLGVGTSTYREPVVRRRSWVTAAILAASLVATFTLGSASSNRSAAPTGPPTAVVVRAEPGVSAAGLAATIEELGGEVVRELGIVNGVAAVVPEGAVAILQDASGVHSVTEDQELHPTAVDPNLGYDTATDMGTLSAVTQILGVQDAWAAGFTGRGIGVALIDTGVTRVPGLTAGQVIDGPDLSLDSGNPDLLHLDAYGHGTHMAGIIAGRDDGAVASAVGCTTCVNASGYSDTTKFVGVAPDAKIINVKVGAADGATDVSQVIAALDWVVQHKDDPGLNIKVINLSFGANSSQPYVDDPLAYAAEVAWRRGIVVVAAAGNDGKAVASLASPAYHPLLLAVGATNPNGTLDPRDDTVAPFATHGTPNRKVDNVAPGVSITSLRVPGSYIDQNYPGGVVGTRFVRGSGTSQAAAQMAGLVAVMQQQYPTATPDSIKQLLAVTGVALPTVSSLYRGNGLADADKASDRGSVPLGTQSLLPGATGFGTLEAARGGAYVTDGISVLTGERDVHGAPWVGSTWRASAWTGSTWRGGTWNGSRWTADTWLSGAWPAADDVSPTWSGSRWTGSRWTGNTWDGSTWRGSWSGSTWRTAGWSQAAWSSASWT